MFRLKHTPGLAYNSMFELKETLGLGPLLYVRVETYPVAKEMSQSDYNACTDDFPHYEILELLWYFLWKKYT